jgi:acid phosphatase family membrane protein YuiD
MIGKLVISIFAAWVLTKIIKVIIDSSKEGFSLKNFFRDGGMPSNHTAFVVATVVSLFFETGFSYITALSVVLALIVINDAMKVRWITGEQSKAINRLTQGKQGFSKLEERVGHTLPEVIVGAIIGALVPIIIYLVF